MQALSSQARLPIAVASPRRIRDAGEVGECGTVVVGGALFPPTARSARQRARTGLGLRLA